MSLLQPSFLTAIPIPPARRRLYHALRAILYAGFLSIVSVIGYSFLFPSQGFTFDFRNPDAAKNTLLDPRDADDTPERKGAVKENGTLTLNNGALGIFSDAAVSIQLKKDSSLPKNITLTAQKGYREVFLPEGPAAEFPGWKSIQLRIIDGHANGSLFRIGGNVYQLIDGTLYRFVSDNALLSRYDSDTIISQGEEFLSRYPVSEEWIGFRPGTLLSFADGVFVVYSETDIRPIGSADIFQAIGYNWDDVIPASEEEIGMYKRGKIIIPGTLHAPGTLFQVAETGNYFTIDGEKHQRPITDLSLLQLFLKHTHPIPVSEKSRELSSYCTLQPGVFFTSEYACDVPLQTLRDLPGADYQFTLAPEEAIAINTIDITLKRSPEKGNFRSTLSQLKVRLLDRYSN